MRKSFEAISRTLIILTLLASCSDVFESNYQNQDEAETDGALLQGWLPNWLPKSAKNIYEMHNLDTNAVAFSFDIPKSETQVQKLKCRKISSAPKPRIKSRTFPAYIQKKTRISLCDGFYVYQSGQTIYVWANKFPR